MGWPVVSCPYMAAAEMPIPCWPRDCLSRWNLEPYSSLPKIFGTCALTMPGPLSSTTTTKRPSPLVSSPSPLASSPRSRTSMVSSGRMPASSQASSELSTASLMVVRSALEGLSKPSRCRFLVKNSEMEISRCLVAICSAVARRLGARSASAGAPATTSGSTSTSATCFSTGGRDFAAALAGAGFPGCVDAALAGRAGALAGAVSRSESCRSAFTEPVDLAFAAAALFVATMVLESLAISTASGLAREPLPRDKTAAGIDHPGRVVTR